MNGISKFFKLVKCCFVNQLFRLQPENLMLYNMTVGIGGALLSKETFLDFYVYIFWFHIKLKYFLNFT